MMLEEIAYRKKHFNKNFIMTEKEKNSRSWNTCWICEKLIDDDKVNHCHITRKYREPAHWSCNVNLKLI